MQAPKQFDHSFSLDPNDMGELRSVVWAKYVLGLDDDIFDNLPKKVRNNDKVRTYYALVYRRSRSTAVVVSGNLNGNEACRKMREPKAKRPPHQTVAKTTHYTNAKSYCA